MADPLLTCAAAAVLPASKLVTALTNSGCLTQAALRAALPWAMADPLLTCAAAAVLPASKLVTALTTSSCKPQPALRAALLLVMAGLLFSCRAAPAPAAYRPAMEMISSMYLPQARWETSPQVVGTIMSISVRSLGIHPARSTVVATSIAFLLPPRTPHSICVQ